MIPEELQAWSPPFEGSHPETGPRERRGGSEFLSRNGVGSRSWTQRKTEPGDRRQGRLLPLPLLCDPTLRSTVCSRLSAVRGPSLGRRVCPAPTGRLPFRTTSRRGEGSIGRRDWECVEGRSPVTPKVSESPTRRSTSSVLTRLGPPVVPVGGQSCHGRESQIPCREERAPPGGPLLSPTVSDADGDLGRTMGANMSPDPVRSVFLGTQVFRRVSDSSERSLR